jgi:hypothetical protein
VKDKKAKIANIEIDLGEPKITTKDIAIPVEVESLDPGTKIELRYRVNYGEVRTAATRLVKKEDEHARFTAKLPGLHAGDLVEYSAMLVRPEGEQPAGEEFSGFEAFRVTENGLERISATDLTGELDATFPALNDHKFQPRLKPVQFVFRPTSKDEPPVEDNEMIELELGVEVFSDLVKERQLAVTQVHKSLDMIKTDLNQFFPKVKEVFPDTIMGELLNPNGLPAERVAVEALKPEYTSGENVSNIAWPTPEAITDERGVFTLRMPRVPIPQKGLTLRVRGRSNSTSLALERTDFLGTKGQLGFLTLNRELAPLPTSIISQLKDLVPANAEDAEENPEDFAEHPPAMTLGEAENCSQVFHSNSGVIDRHRYSILFRLVDPLISQAQPIVRFPISLTEQPDRFLSLSLTLNRNSPAFERAINRALLAHGQLRFVERVPVSRPIDVTDFFTDIAENPDSVPKAASLGLGYVLKMHTTWVPAGLSLGDMVYALALAPGEEQRVAIFEQEQQLAVREAERLGIADDQSLTEARDTSTEAVFESALREAASGGSSFHTEADSWGVGVAGGIGGFVSGLLFGVGAAGSYGSSSSSGSSNTWQKGSRDFVSSATEDFHSRLSRAARSRRQVNRTSVRLATASDREEITTKVIANHNHCHALTMQYWEVLRHFSVNTQIDDTQLVCFVPLDIIQFLPDGQSLSLPTAGITRAFLLHRYQMLILYHDALAHRLRRRRQYFHGLQLLRDFAANPAMGIEVSTGLAEDIVEISAEGTFLPFEDVSVSLYSDSGGHLGTSRLSPAGSVAEVPTGDNGFVSTEELLQYLRNRRIDEAGSTHVRAGQIRLPRHISRSDVARFELTRRFQTFTYRLKPPTLAEAGNIFDGISGTIFDILNSQNRTVTLSPTQLEREVGGPVITSFKADIQDENDVTIITFVDDTTPERMGTRLLIPSREIPPALSATDILHIESVFQHIVSNTVSYSKTIWQSLTPEERAILLERFTIGVPEGGVEDATQEVPLLNCVANEVLGFYGNAMIMPFHIPPQVAERMKVTTRDVQEALLTFHREGFTQNKTSLTLPTRGMLGEAILGNCNACEKIDITRFWNWQDSPHDKAAPAELPPEFRGQSLIGTAGAQAPSVLKADGQPVNLLNVNTSEGGAEASSLAAKLIEQAVTSNTFGDLTGKQELSGLQTKTLDTAESARKDALAAAKGVAEKVLDILPDVIKAKAGIDEEQKKKDEEQKKKDEEAAEKKKSDGIEKLKAGSNSFILLAGNQPDDEKANEMAKQIVKEIFGDDLPGFFDLATLVDKFAIKADDSDNVKRGKTAILTALGLPVFSF